MEAPEFYQIGYSTPEKLFPDSKNCEHFMIDDLLDFPNDESMVGADGSFEEPMVAGTSTITAADTSCNSSFSTIEPHFQNGSIVDGTHSVGDCFSSELCVPYDDQVELEWLSNIVDETFSCEELDLQKLQLIQGMKARNTEGPTNHQYQIKPDVTETTTIFRPEMPVTAKARSKRSRTAPANWTLRLLAVSPPPAVNIPATSSSSESHHISTGKKTLKQPISKKNEGLEESGRKCLHCATDKTPQWRTGPMGPKTLCNACGVRYKSGRLVPEYRPAASPTFVLTKHSNSHRKVIELRRQKEMVRVQHHQQHQFLHQNAMIDVSNGNDYLIHQHIGPDFGQLI